MKILVVLWTVSLVRFCSAGGDGKVDSTLFDLVDSVEDNVKVLKLTAKEGTSTNELTFDGQTVWEDKKKLCSSAILYMDGEKPTLAVLVTRDNKNNKQGTVYRYHDGKQWKDGKEEDHKKKLEDLKERCKPGEILDIAKPDGSNIDVHTENAYGVSLKEYTPKSAFHISSLTDGDKELWKGADKEHALSVLVYYAKENSTLITIGINKDTGSKLDFKHFEKTVNGKWTLIKKEDYDQKLKDLKSGVTNPSSSSDPSTPS